MQLPLDCAATRITSKSWGFWDPAKEDTANLAWVGRLFADMQPFNAGEVYVNSLDEGEGDRVREAYGTNYAKLVMLKAKFDPTNFFPANQKGGAWCKRSTTSASARPT